MWKDSIRNIVVIFQTTILRIVRFYVRCSAHFFAISFHKLFLASLPPHYFSFSPSHPSGVTKPLSLKLQEIPAFRDFRIRDPLYFVILFQ